jgi:hypothetical protein
MMSHIVCIRISIIAVALLSLVQAAAIAASTGELSTPAVESTQGWVSLQDSDSTERSVEHCSFDKSHFEQLHSATSLEQYVEENEEPTQRMRSCIEALFATLYDEPQVVRVTSFRRIILFVDGVSDKSGNVRCVTMVFIVAERKSMSRGCSVFPRDEFWDPESHKWVRKADCERMVPVCAQEPAKGPERYQTRRLNVDANLEMLGDDGYVTLVYDSEEGLTLRTTVTKTLGKRRDV